jgi:hypothetical protein
MPGDETTPGRVPIVLYDSQINAMIPITKATPPITPINSTIPHMSPKPIQPAIERASASTALVPNVLKQNSDTFITPKFSNSICLISNILYTVNNIGNECI